MNLANENQHTSWTWLQRARSLKLITKGSHREGQDGFHVPSETEMTVSIIYTTNMKGKQKV